MASRLFFFGRTPELSFVEISSFVASMNTIRKDIVEVAGSFISNGTNLTDAQCMNILGGIVKIATVLARTQELDPARLLSHFELKNKVVFALSGYGLDKTTITRLDQEIKKLFHSSHISSRFVLPKEGSVVSSVAIVKEHVEEVVIVKDKDGYIIGKTTAIQQFSEWNERDYQRPYVDPQSGMLPPKIARMIVNIGLGRDSRGKTLLDPFCGMGTICAEAAMRGVNVIGSDSDKETIEKAQKNMSWLLSRYRLSSSIRLLHADATHIDEIIDKKTIDAIVTEPFLGSSRIGKDEQINRNKLQKIIKGLEKLYIGSLKCWTLILKSRGIVVIAFPEYAVNTGTYGVKKVIDRCETLGYTKVLGPIAYSRPQAKVKRLFFVFQKKI